MKIIGEGKPHEKKIITVYLPTKIYERVKKHADEEERSFSRTLTYIIKKYFKDEVLN